jgi:RNA polymerase sigma factor (TIGR02999 family)
MVESEQRADVTQMLLDWSQGDEASLERLMPVVYDELKRLARIQMGRERSDHTLQPTAVVHEAYFRLVDAQRIAWRDRAHFFAVASRLIRRVLVDHARRHRADKRGAGVAHLTIDDVPPVGEVRADEIVALDEALKSLEELDPRQGRVVEMRYFGGLTIEETAAVLKISPATVKREWSVASAWLRRELAAAP